MYLRTLLTLGLVLSASAQATESVAVYHYGMPLDIARVVQMSEPDTELCDVVQARMVSVDSAGQLYDGTQMEGPAGLRAALLKKKDAFLSEVTCDMKLGGCGVLYAK